MSVEKAGARRTQFTILQVLDRRERVRQGDFGELLALDTTTLTRTLKLLERDGLIVSEPGKDRRERYWVLTAAGEKKIEEARPAWERAQGRLKDSLDDLPWSEMMQVADAITYAAKRGQNESDD